MKDLFTRVRPQILVFGAVLGAVSLYALRLDAVEVVGMAVGGLIAISMKILEDKD
jgi:dethiobiotin synthetase